MSPTAQIALLILRIHALNGIPNGKIPFLAQSLARIVPEAEASLGVRSVDKAQKSDGGAVASKAASSPLDDRILTTPFPSAVLM